MIDTEFPRVGANQWDGNTSAASSLGHVPAAARWEFDTKTASVFDDMIARSIPGYASMRRIVALLTNHFCQPGGWLVDLGCSTGIGIKDFAVDRNVVGVEIAESMLDVVRERFKSFASVTIEKLDLRRDFPSVAHVDVVLAIFTLQFIPVEHRRRVVRRAYNALRTGGALIVAEKCVAETSATQDALTEIYHGFKMQQGYTAEEVDRKALSLEGVLVPQTAAGNHAMLAAAGFRDVECVWRWANFAAWIAVK